MAAAQNTKFVLPKKELELFRSVVSCYETKQYRKGLKNADIVLKKYPNHGETLAMKGLILNCTGKKEEAYELVKLGIKNDIKSSTCWHVYGLVYKSDGNYKEASKCYLNAIRIDPSNQNILRDLSWLQVQMRDMVGYVGSRRKILDSKPNLRPSWVAYAVSLYLAGEFAMAYTVIEKYFENLAGTALEGSAEKYEESEFLLFQNRCLEKQGLYTEAIAHLEKHTAAIVDKLSASTKIAEFLVRSGNFAAAKEKWLTLALSQTENYRFHCGLQAAYLEIASTDCDAIFGLKRLDLPCSHLSLSPAQIATLNELYSAHTAFVKSRAVSKIRLHLVNSTEELRPLLDAHFRKCLVDGVPSLYHDVSYLVRQPELLNPSNVAIVSDPTDFRNHPVAVLALDLVAGYIAQFRSTGHFSQADAEAGKPKENPAALLWALYLQANLLERSGLLEDATRVINECTEHTPTALDMHVRFGKILKKSGAVTQASLVLENVRSLDLQDRYLNNKATKYLLRANNITQAMDTIAMFTKHDGSDPQQTLTDLQCNWYELELAEAYARTSKWGLSLKKFYSIQKHFLDYVEDMFDFHSYAQSRKTTLRMYTDALVMQDNIFSHPFYQRATRGALKIFLYLLDNPDDIDGLAHLPKEERKKERARLKKKKAKDEKEEAKSSSSSSAAANDETDKKVDTDPLGEKLLTKNFIDEANTFCKHLSSRLHACDPTTLALVAEVQLRRGKLVQVARTLHLGLAKHPNEPNLIVMLVKLHKRIRSQSDAASPSTSSTPILNETVLSALNAELNALLNGQDIQVFVANYLELATSGINSLPHRLAAARALVLTATNKGAAGAKTRAAELMLEEGLWSGRGVTLLSVVSVLKFLRDELKNEEISELFRVRALLAFPQAESLSAVVKIEADNDEADDAGPESNE